MAHLLRHGDSVFLMGKYILTAAGLPFLVVYQHYPLCRSRFRVGWLLPVFVAPVSGAIVSPVEPAPGRPAQGDSTSGGGADQAPSDCTGAGWEFVVGERQPAMMTIYHAILAILWAILGSCLGSFLNVCIHRIPRRMSLLRPRSRCPHCGTAIHARDNVPVAGWLLPARPMPLLPPDDLPALPGGRTGGGPALRAALHHRRGVLPGRSLGVARRRPDARRVGRVVDARRAYGLRDRRRLRRAGLVIPSRAQARHRPGEGCEGPAASGLRSPADPG